LFTSEKPKQASNCGQDGQGQRVKESVQDRIAITNGEVQNDTEDDHQPAENTDEPKEKSECSLKLRSHG
jgi:hypothetical protein